MSAESGYTPLNEVNTKRVKVGVKLPYQLNESVGLNTFQTEMLMQIAGIRDIVLTNDTAPAFSIAGVGGDGTATGIRVASVPISREKNIKEDALPNCAWSSLEVAINEEAVIEKLKSRRKDVKNPAYWAHVVNNAIKDGIILGSSDNLLKRDKYVYATVAGITGLVVPTIKDGLFVLIATTIGAYAVDHIIGINYYGKERPGAGRRWSISPIFLPELDRALVLNLLTPLTKLAKEVK